jgi:hypothetical protein
MSRSESRAARRFLGLVWVGAAFFLGGQIGGKPAEAQTCSATSGIRVGPSDGESLDQLGTSVALSGSTAFLGAPGRVNPDPSLPAWSTTGTVYVARRNGSTWNITQQMFAPDGANMDKFGQAVALDGTWGVVGAPGDDSSAGSAYLYQSNADGSLWSYRQKLLSPTRTAYEYFGQSVAISGSTIVVGAYGNGVYKGKAYVYHWNGSTWTSAPVKTLTASDSGVVAATYDFFAYPVAISGNVILVGVYGDDIIGTNSGSVYVYRSTDSGVTWAYSQTFWPSDVASGDSFGSSVALDGTAAVIGASGDDSITGSAYLFRDNGSSFQWEAKLTASDRKTLDRFGLSVAISGSGILVGAPYWTNNARGIAEQGKAYYFAYDGTSWQEKLSLLQISPWGYYSDHFGSAVALDGGTAVVGTPGEDPPAPTDSGKAYFFDITCAGCLTNADCDDANDCTTDVCNTTDGTCSNTSKPPGSACTTDNNVCTTDTCDSAGVCRHVNNTNPCTDGNACTAGDHCSNGLCVGTPFNCDDGNACTTDSCLAGVCQHVNNTIPCDDGSSCTTGDRCASGLCIGTPLNCDDGKACTTDSCNPATGCVRTNNTLPCNDGLYCNGTDTCSTGTCGVHAGNPCASGAVCARTCNETTHSCVFDPNGTPCDDGNPITSNDACSNGVCVGSGGCVANADCDDGNACTTDTCNLTTHACTNTNNTNTCSDDGNLCTSDVCSAGACTHPLKGNGTACDDGNACTQTATCQSGTCIGSNPVVCPAADQCHNPGTCNTSTGVCSAPTVKANGTTCNDGNACTLTSTCQSGVCTGSNPVVCTADQCHNPGTCNTSTGVCSAPTVKTNGTTCNDGNACTTADSCSSGVCVGGPSPNLGAGVSCTSDCQCASNSCKGKPGAKKCSK